MRFTKKMVADFYEGMNELLSVILNNIQMNYQQTDTFYVKVNNYRLRYRRITRDKITI